MRIFITGGTGFIGRFILKKLSHGKNKLLVLTRYPEKIKNSKYVRPLKGDLSGNGNWAKKLKDFKPDVAIHLAWEGIPDYGIKNSIKNLNQGLSLFQILAETGCKKIISAGSLWEYGNQTGKISETDRTLPFNTFTASKNSLNYLGREIAKENGIDFIWARIFYVYGPGQKSTSLIPYLINSLSNNKTPEIRNPEAKNDFIYVEDVADAILSLLKSDSVSGEYNIGSGKLSSIKNIINIISSNLKTKIGFDQGDKKQLDKISSVYADISKVRKDTGWSPATPIKQGIEKTIRAFNSQK